MLLAKNATEVRFTFAIVVGRHDLVVVVELFVNHVRLGRDDHCLAERNNRIGGVQVNERISFLQIEFLNGLRMAEKILPSRKKILGH